MRTAFPSSRCVLLLAGLVLAAAGPPATRAADPDPPAGQPRVSLPRGAPPWQCTLFDNVQLHVEDKLYQDEIKNLGGSADDEPDRKVPETVEPNRKVPEAVLSALELPGNARSKALLTASNAANTALDGAVNKWITVQDQYAAFWKHAATVEKKEGIEFSPASVESSLIDWPLILTVLAGLALWAVAVALAYHELRVSVRREWRAGRRWAAATTLIRGVRPPAGAAATAVLLAALLTSLLAAPGCSSTRADDTSKITEEAKELITQYREARDTKKPAAGEATRSSPPLRLEKDKDGLEKKVLGSATTASEERLKHVRERTTMLAQGLKPGSDAGLGVGFRNRENEDYRLLREIRFCEDMIKDLHADAEHTLTVLRKLDEMLTGQVTAARGGNRTSALVHLGLAVGFAGLAFVPLVRAKRLRRREVAFTEKQCPRCLSHGKLKEKSVTVKDPRYPDPKFLECAECNYEFRHSYLKHPRLCFPTVGVISSGKTRCLVTAYDLIQRSEVGVKATLKQIPSLGDDRFTKMIELVIEGHNNPGATVHGHRQLDLLEPLAFHVADADQMQSSCAMLNLFDFSGEVMRGDIKTDLLRRRALQMDGFLMFLDPTQLEATGKTVSIREQIKSLRDFTNDMHDARHVDQGKGIPMPVAVCISKIDLLAQKGQLSNKAREWLQQIRTTKTKRLTLDVIHKRSRLCRQVLPNLFPGWDLVNALKQGFGDNYMFFPLTPVSLGNPAPAAKVAGGKINLDPFGVTEPILWLLHMHGYRIFH